MVVYQHELPTSAELPTSGFWMNPSIKFTTFISHAVVNSLTPATVEHSGQRSQRYQLNQADAVSSQETAIAYVVVVAQTRIRQNENFRFILATPV